VRHRRPQHETGHLREAPNPHPVVFPQGVDLKREAVRVFRNRSRMSTQGVTRLHFASPDLRLVGRVWRTAGARSSPPMQVADATAVMSKPQWGVGPVPRGLWPMNNNVGQEKRKKQQPPERSGGCCSMIGCGQARFGLTANTPLAFRFEARAQPRQGLYIKRAPLRRLATSSLSLHIPRMAQRRRAALEDLCIP